MGVFFFSSRRRHTRYWRDWSSDVCSSDLSDQFTTYNDNGLYFRTAPPDTLQARALADLIIEDGNNTVGRSEEHTSELQSRQYLVCRLLLEKKKNKYKFSKNYNKYINDSHGR